LPPGVRVTVSFAQPHETVRGAWEVQEEEKISRTIAIDKTRKIKFVIPAEDQAAAGPREALDGPTAEKAAENPDMLPEDRMPDRAGLRTPQRGRETMSPGTRSRVPQGTSGGTPRRTNEQPRQNTSRR
jgi:hypothetical protein